jgi:hypothetical protein
MTVFIFFNDLKTVSGLNVGGVLLVDAYCLHVRDRKLSHNPFLKKLLLREENRRLKRNWPIDLI